MRGKQPTRSVSKTERRTLFLHISLSSYFIMKLNFLQFSWFLFRHQSIDALINNGDKNMVPVHEKPRRFLFSRSRMRGRKEARKDMEEGRKDKT